MPARCRYGVNCNALREWILLNEDPCPYKHLQWEIDKVREETRGGDIFVSDVVRVKPNRGPASSMKDTPVHSSLVRASTVRFFKVISPQKKVNVYTKPKSSSSVLYTVPTGAVLCSETIGQAEGQKYINLVGLENAWVAVKEGDTKLLELIPQRDISRRLKVIRLLDDRALRVESQPTRNSVEQGSTKELPSDYMFESDVSFSFSNEDVRWTFFHRAFLGSWVLGRHFSWKADEVPVEKGVFVYRVGNVAGNGVTVRMRPTASDEDKILDLVIPTNAVVSATHRVLEEGGWHKCVRLQDRTGWIPETKGDRIRLLWPLAVEVLPMSVEVSVLEKQPVYHHPDPSGKVIATVAPGKQVTISHRVIGRRGHVYGLCQDPVGWLVLMTGNLQEMTVSTTSPSVSALLRKGTQDGIAPRVGVREPPGLRHGSSSPALSTRAISPRPASGLSSVTATSTLPPSIPISSTRSLSPTAARGHSRSGSTSSHLNYSMSPPIAATSSMDAVTAPDGEGKGMDGALQTKCVVCLVAEREMVLVHGEDGHRCVCKACGEELVHCPVCSRFVERKVRCYG